MTSTLGATRQATRTPAPVGRVFLPRPPNPGVLRPLAIFAADARGEVVQIDAAGYRNVQNLQQLALAMHNYEDAQGSLPGQYLQTGGAPGLSWRVTILPYLPGTPPGRFGSW